MDDSYPFLRFNTSARSFLAKSIDHLMEFEQEETLENFFYAALELRFGIEARLNEYLEPALRSIGKEICRVQASETFVVQTGWLNEQ